MPCISASQIEQALDDWADFILKNVQTEGAAPTALVGLISRGELLAQRLQTRLAAAGCEVFYGAIDITLYRDDFSMKGRKPALRSSYLPFSTDGLNLILIDDVLHTGRTVRAALNALFDYGRPASVELHCLVERSGRQLPIQPDYAAFCLDNAPEQGVRLQLQELHGQDSITY